jgi:hypothetical protein
MKEIKYTILYCVCEITVPEVTVPVLLRPVIKLRFRYNKKLRFLRLIRNTVLFA